jgi:MFS family permease
VSLLTVGHLVHRFGTRKALTASATLLFGAIALIGHLTSTWQFLLAVIALGAGISAFHISVNGQAFHEQAPVGERLIPRMHGFWSAGALSSAILSGFLVNRVSLALHLDVLAAIVYVIILFLLRKFDDSLLRGNHEPKTVFTLGKWFSSFTVDWVITIGLTCGTMLEFATGDWSTIFAKEDLHMSAGVSTIPYILIVFAMIIGRLNVHRITEYVGIEHLVRRCAIGGGATFIVSVTLGVQVSKSSPTLGFVIVAIGMFVTGLGLSFLAPTFMDAANRRSKAPGSVVLGQLGAINTLFSFALKGVIAWTAQLTSIAIALMIPAVMLIGVAFTANAVKKNDI